MTTTQRPSLVIDLFSDFVCPWCFVGHHRLNSVLAEYEGKADIQVRHHPFLLQPATPPEGINIAEMIRNKYGADPAQMNSHVRQAALQSGLDFDPGNVERMVPTLAAHTLTRNALAKGTRDAMVRALFGAYFQEIRDISQAEVLVEVATEHGFSEDEVRELIANPQEEEATRSLADRAVKMGISGVPFFVLNSKFALSGAQQPDAFRKAIDRALAEKQD